MAEQNSPKKELDDLLVAFWHTFPPIWHVTRSLTHQTATEEFGITAAQFHTLRRIWEGKTSVSALADCMHLSRPNISRSVDELVNMGLVERQPEAADRRAISLTLSPRGRELVANMLESIGAKMKLRLSRLELKDTKAIAAALNALRKAFIEQENS
jgi:DNA-binding MarR family transcriptional regulator